MYNMYGMCNLYSLYNMYSMCKMYVRMYVCTQVPGSHMHPYAFIYIRHASVAPYASFKLPNANVQHTTSPKAPKSTNNKNYKIVTAMGNVKNPEFNPIHQIT